MQWIPTSLRVNNNWRIYLYLFESFAFNLHIPSKFNDQISLTKSLFLTFRRSTRNYSLPYFTRCFTGIRIHTPKRLYTPVDTRQSYSYQPNEGGAMRLPRIHYAYYKWSTYAATVWFAAKQCEKSELAGARGARTKFDRLHGEIGCL